MPVYFKSVEPIDLSADGSTAGYDIYFERVDSPPTPDAKVESLRRDYEETAFVLKNMGLTPAEFGTIFNNLVEGGRVGLQGDINESSLSAGASQLNNVRRDMVRLASKGRDKYLGQLTLVGLVVTAVSLVVAAIVGVVPYLIHDQSLKAAFITHVRAWLLPACLLHPGVCLGVVFVGFVLNRSFTFEKITNFDAYAFSPWMRILFISVVSYVLLSALWFKVILLGAGSFLLNDVTTIPQAGFLIGMICGVSEPVVVQLLLSRLKPVEKEK
jgi:hypothetical protein